MEALGDICFGQPFYAVSFVVLCVVLVCTRLVSAANSASKIVSRDGAKTPPAAPYWIPFLGHIPNMIMDATGFVGAMRDFYSGGLFTLYFGGTRHTLVYKPALVTALMNQKASHADSEFVHERFMRNCFGFPSAEMDKYNSSLPDVVTVYKYLASDPYFTKMVETTARNLRENITNLVTFMESPVDQMRWERLSNPVLVQSAASEEVLEVSLLPLIREFCALTANSSLMGFDFDSNFTEFFDDLWAFDNGSLLLATGLPSWFPIPSLTRARIARKHIHDQLEEFHSAMDKYLDGKPVEARWARLDDVSAFVKARTEAFRKHNLSIHARACCDHALVWASHANSNMLVFWMVYRIFRDSALLARVREEIAPYVKLTKPETSLPIAEAPGIASFDIDGLTTKCPLLKSCYIECLRVDASSWSLRVIQQDFVLKAHEKDAQAYLLRKGDYAHAAHELHNTDPASYEAPLEWKGDRHIKHDPETQKPYAETGSIRSYGGGQSMCKGRRFAFYESMIFAAAFVAMWEMEAPGGREWKVPKSARGSGVNKTDDDIRVRVRRRNLSADEERIGSNGSESPVTYQ